MISYIALAPLIFAVLQTEGMQWQDFFWVLGVIGAVGAVLIYLLRKYLTIADSKSKLTGQKEITDASCIEEPDRDWRSFIILISLTAVHGMVYSGVITFFKDESFLDHPLISQFLRDWTQSSVVNHSGHF